MNESWEERFVDHQVDKAWLDLRLRLADRFAAALADGGMEGVGISGPTGQTLTVLVEDGRVVVVTDALDTAATDNVDEAAHTIYRVLRDDWQVVHPAFLDTDLVEVPAEAPREAAEPGPAAEVRDGLVMGTAESTEQLHTWVVASLSSWLNRRVKVNPDGTVVWNTRGGNLVVLRVHNAGRIELHAVLAREVGFKRAHELIDELSKKWFALKFFLERDSLIVSQLVIAQPFVPEQLVSALKAFLRDVDKLDWVQEKVERKRTQRLRVEVGELTEAVHGLERAKRKAERERDRAKRALRSLRRARKGDESRSEKQKRRDDA
ncbi:T3SS (YopN, CesT) and YbjN peptide-binding chaperone 1 [Nocardioides alcanivorans]|uniref:T3SS (YopN, CesT) and YbjN peptide-binding chaperone 1 n=1 Tax=Nocardioides alcanivorans TaxID=2897352 RepID=UPI001F3C5250|nr:hypothetical protein [Nocardioides alcanivorans]